MGWKMAHAPPWRSKRPLGAPPALELSPVPSVGCSWHGQQHARFRALVAVGTASSRRGAVSRWQVPCPAAVAVAVAVVLAAAPAQLERGKCVILVWNCPYALFYLLFASFLHVMSCHVAHAVRAATLLLLLQVH